MSEYDPSYQPSDYSIPFSLRIDFDVLKPNFQRSLIKQINYLKEMNVYMSASDPSRLFGRTETCHAECALVMRVVSIGSSQFAFSLVSPQVREAPPASERVAALVGRTKIGGASR